VKELEVAKQVLQRENRQLAELAKAAHVLTEEKIAYRILLFFSFSSSFFLSFLKDLVVCDCSLSTKVTYLESFRDKCSQLEVKLAALEKEKAQW